MFIVTGGAGFIGSHLVDALISIGEKVVVVDNFSRGKYRREDVEYLNIDITSNSFIDKLAQFKDVKAVFHLAALASVKESNEHPDDYINANIIGTKNVLELCRRLNADFVFASSSTVYGNAGIPTKEDTPLRPVSVYGATKVAGEALASAYSHLYGFDSIILRFANIFGERSTRGVMYDFFVKLNKNPNELIILGDGNQKKSYLYVKDAVDAIITAYFNHKENFDVFNVGSREQHSVNEIGELISNELSISPKFTHTGGNVGWKGDVPLMLLDTTKIESIGWRQRFSFEEGLHMYIEWLKQTH